MDKHNLDFRMSDEILELYGSMYERFGKNKSFKDYCLEHITNNLKSIGKKESYDYRFFGGEVGGNAWWEN